jgi:D-ornithine 4,5-aminomutase subunit alpha
MSERMARLEARLRALDDVPDEELKQRFWALSDQVVAPLVELARTHTSPSIERSVLLRMGIDSVTASGVVAHVHEAGLLGKGAGHVLLRLAQREHSDMRTAAAAVLADPSVLHGLFDSPAAGRPGGPHE